jgi:hypothetical protein
MSTKGKTARPRTQLILLGACALGLCLSAMRPALADEVIYKSIGPNGDISYSWRPDPDALRIETIKVDALSPEQRRAMKRFQRNDAKAEQRADVYAADMEDQWTRVDNEITNAQADLRQAEAALEAGRTPLPGERRGNRDGGTRLAQTYFDRLHGLELEVERARQRLDKAYSARDALK